MEIFQIKSKKCSLQVILSEKRSSRTKKRHLYIFLYHIKYLSKTKEHIIKNKAKPPEQKTIY